MQAGRESKIRLCLSWRQVARTKAEYRGHEEGGLGMVLHVFGAEERAERSCCMVLEEDVKTVLQDARLGQFHGRCGCAALAVFIGG